MSVEQRQNLIETIYELHASVFGIHIQHVMWDDLSDAQLSKWHELLLIEQEKNA